jgi:hemolysin III
MKWPRIRLREREQTPGEEIANSISHGVGMLAAVVAAVVLIGSTLQRGDTSRTVGVSIFAGSMVFLYLTSTLYHALRPNRAKRVFKILDHSAILLLIAGTYTPFTLGVLRDTVGGPLLVFVWILAAGGVAFTAITRVRYPTVFTLLVLAMGWTILVAAKPLWQHMDPWGLFWLAAGGAAYTGGVAFFAADRIRFGHLVWHLCVILGTTCHYIAVWRYAA